MDRETMLASNRSLAEESLARRPRLCNGKIQLAEKYRELSNLATTCWEKQSQLGESTAAGSGGGGRCLVSGRMAVHRCCQDELVVAVTGSHSRAGWVNTE